MDEQDLATLRLLAESLEMFSRHGGNLISPLDAGAAAPVLMRAADTLSDLSRLQKERDAALRECSEWATKAGLATGKLEMSEAAGIVEGWKEKCEGLQTANAELRRCLGFFASVIKSGEPWTETCEQEYRKALSSPEGAEG